MASWHTGYLAGREAQQLFRDIANQFHVSPDQLADITQHFISEMQVGLKENKSPLAML
jgi:hexokinase